jgi:ATP-binding cassette, subfamily B, bacterial MsbA
MSKRMKEIRVVMPLLRLYPWSIPTIIIIGLLASLMEGFGISLLIPFLQDLAHTGEQLNTGNFLIDFLNGLFVNIPPNNRLIVIPLFILGCIFLKSCFVYGNAVLFSWLNARISHILRYGIFHQLLTVSYSFLDSDSTGKYMNTLDKETWQTSSALEYLVSILINACTIVVFVILLFLISWRLAILVGVVMLLISLVVRLITRKAEKMGQDGIKACEDLTIRMWEAFSGMRVVRALGRESYEKKRFARKSNQVSTSFMKLDMFSAAVGPLYEVLANFLLLCILVIAILQNWSDLPVLLTFMFFIFRLQPQMMQFDSNHVSLMALTDAVTNVLSLINRSDKPYIHPGKTVFHSLNQGLTFESVTFQYNSNAEPSLQNLSMHIPSCKTTAIVGPSGAGKSTIVNLICRLYDVNGGRLLVDDIPLNQFKLTDWRRQIAVVRQNDHIFSATIRENIAYGRLDATESEIVTAAKQANAHDFIRNLKMGYETHVGDRGVLLSAGERQRIALARAVIRNPQILILDEATNAIDSISENLIQETLQTFGGSRTTIVIAHRLSTIEQADQIIVLENGRVIEQGVFHELLKQKGLFARLYELQHSLH